ncbi:ABC transporter ATP-binding protein [Paenibacillus hexagrammi]|uniref:ATP-binding cassette domain-containing protein n=1 Tax=Paenibacillus hexagrammi TaxID=2908839 RepID=A0ABY3SC02_9BACL|nr:ATP-binding cassette domain-containing protein [Paenibacillus sp. YPD9-1]UJF31499.1 ATP-binding cassette domain-containing protein [Paenibacillus sp. YPD9-1]
MVQTGLRIRLDGVSKTYGSTEVLKGIELEMKAGEFIAVVGRSGCGKSTLLRLIAGLEQPSSGSIHADAARINGIHPEIRVMFQESRLLPWKKVLNNVRIGLGDKSEALAEEALRLVGLGDRKNEYPSVLSGGQKQRVALARALASHPRVLLLDEPLGALDALTRIEMQDLIGTIWEDQRFTALLVTHDVSEAIALADRVIVIEEGKTAVDQPIPLARPRERDADFMYYEKLILDRLMQRTRSGAAPSRKII